MKMKGYCLAHELIKLHDIANIVQGNLTFFGQKPFPAEKIADVLLEYFTKVIPKQIVNRIIDLSDEIESLILDHSKDNSTYIKELLFSYYNVPIYWTTILGGYGIMKVYEETIT